MNFKLFSFLILAMIGFSIYSQDKVFKLKIRDLHTDIYDYSKPKKNVLKVFYGNEALDSLEIRVGKNAALKNFIGGWMEEQDIISYYPSVDIALFEDPATSVSVFDLKNMKDACGDPTTYAYSPSGKYRVSSLNADGVHHYLEEKIDGIYQRSQKLEIDAIIYSFYWKNYNTVYYLQERRRYIDNETEIKYEVAYSIQVLE